MLEDIDFSDMVKTARAYIDSKLVGMDEREQEVFLGQLDKVIARHLTADEKEAASTQVSDSGVPTQVCREVSEEAPKPRQPVLHQPQEVQGRAEATKMLLSEALKEIKRLTYRRY